MRSMLFVPADSERKLEKASASNADALILDLEDSVALPNKPRAREIARAYLTANPPATRSKKLLVRLNPLDGGMTLADLAATVGGAPDGVIMPKFRRGNQVLALDNYLSALEVRDDVKPGSVRILVISTETAEGLLHLGELQGASPRLSHVMWGEFDLSADIGAEDPTAEDGGWDDLYRTARSLALAAAISAGVEPCNTVYTDFKNADGLARAAKAARRAGFTCMPAIHPNQVDIINAAFSVNEQELQWARRVVQAFDADPSLGVVGLDGIMLDKPHYVQARKTIARAEQQG